MRGIVWQFPVATPWVAVVDIAFELLIPRLKFLLQGNQMDLIRILIAILLPPLGVFLQEGLGKHFWINIILTLLGYIPGIVHAVYIIAKK